MAYVWTVFLLVSLSKIQFRIIFFYSKQWGRMWWFTLDHDFVLHFEIMKTIESKSLSLRNTFPVFFSSVLWTPLHLSPQSNYFLFTINIYPKYLKTFTLRYGYKSSLMWEVVIFFSMAWVGPYCHTTIIQRAAVPHPSAHWS
jgi:hypothetical protein